MFAPVFLVHILEHVLTLAVREIDVDVRRLGAILAEEALEEEAERDGIHGGDAEHVADGGIGGGATALAEDALAPRKADDVPDDEEVAREPELRDERELVRQLLLVRDTATCRVRWSPPLMCALCDEPLQVLVGVDARRQRERRQRRAKLAEPEVTALGDVERGADALGCMTPATRDLRRTLEVPLAIRSEARAHLVERALVTQRTEDVVYHAVARAGIVHVVGDDPRNVERAGDLDEAARGDAFFGQAMIPALDGDAAPKNVEQRGRCLARPVGITALGQRSHPATRTTGERKQSCRVRCELVERHARRAARCIASCEGDERGEVAVSLARFGEQGQVGDEWLGVVSARLDGDGELRTDEPAQPRLVRRDGEAHGATELVVIGEREGGEAEFLRARDERLGQRGAVEQGEAGVTVELSVGHRVFHSDSLTRRRASPAPRRTAGQRTGRTAIAYTERFPGERPGRAANR